MESQKIGAKEPTESIYHSCFGKFPQGPHVGPRRNSSPEADLLGGGVSPLQKPSNIAELHSTEAGRESLQLREAASRVI
ncbi:hypothetical protein ANN_21130 [Periplaneta americana]|uniref:Uncharacterized protein n=1 Tax=Periplaneta americana TaxID=6978 RepID=A0ABQ8SFM6_PERAM|nr:hypothetical protein ANN_21130 [Periplaneta americana]